MATTQKYDYVEEAALADLKTEVTAKLTALQALGQPYYGVAKINVIYDGSNYIATLTYQSDAAGVGGTATNTIQHFDYSTSAVSMAALKTAVDAQLAAVVAAGAGNYGIVDIQTIWDGTNYIAFLSYQAYIPAP